MVVEVFPKHVRILDIIVKNITQDVVVNGLPEVVHDEMPNSAEAVHALVAGVHDLLKISDVVHLLQ